MYISDRDAAIYAMRTGGATYEAIGKCYGITRERVHGICKRIEADKNRAAKPDDSLYFLVFGCERGTNLRIYNALRRNGVERVEDFMALKREDIMKMRGLGQKCAAIIGRLQESVKHGADSISD